MGEGDFSILTMFKWYHAVAGGEGFINNVQMIPYWGRGGGVNFNHFFQNQFCNLSNIKPEIKVRLIKTKLYVKNFTLIFVHSHCVKKKKKN